MATKRLQDDLPEGESVELEDVDNEVEDTEDGGAILRETNSEDHATKLAHFANIVDEVDQDLLKTAISDLLEKGQAIPTLPPAVGTYQTQAVIMKDVVQVYERQMELR